MLEIKKLGASEKDVSAVEAVVGFRLPIIYRQFLLEFGVSGTFVGTKYECSCLVEMQKEARELLVENGIDPLILDGYFVFSIHQGYQISCFRKADSDDPEVFCYTEGDESIIGMRVSFSNLIEQLKMEESKYYKVLPPNARS